MPSELMGVAVSVIGPPGRSVKPVFFWVNSGVVFWGFLAQPVAAAQSIKVIAAN
jgi:hypothetical protein